MSNVLLIGNGGREHAILDKLVLSKQVEKVFVCNNTYWDNPYIKLPEYSKVTNHILEDVSIESYINFSKEYNVKLVVVGPEKYLAEGIGTFFLVAVVIGSGIMAENLANGNVAVALLGNTIATGAILFVIIKKTFIF